jgi:hypothetical protein
MKHSRIVMIDAIRVITDELGRIVSCIIPEAEIIHIIDEVLLQHRSLWAITESFYSAS